MDKRILIQTTVVLSLCLAVLAGLVLAASNENPDVIALNLGSVAHFEAKPNITGTPLHVAAAYNGFLSSTTDLLDAGADPKARDEDGNTPLHWAAGFNWNPLIVFVLLHAGADLKARDQDGNTPLHWAAASTENPKIVEMLLEVGTDTKARDKHGRTPFDYAKSNEALKGTEVYRRLSEGQL